MSEHEKWMLRAARVICAAGAAAGIFLLLRFALPLLAPFLAAWGIALLLHPLAEKMSHHTHIPRRLCAILLLTLTLLLLALLLTLGANRLIYELQRLLGWLSGDGGEKLAALAGRLRTWGASLRQSFPFLDFLHGSDAAHGIWENVDQIAADLIADTVSSLSAKIPAAIAAILRALPGILLFLGVWIIAAYSFCLDLRAIHAALSVLLPRAWQGKMPGFRRRAALTALRWLRAYLLLLGLTFCELLIGFLLLGVDYAFLLALLIALLDFLPVFGVGTALIPWAAVMLLSGNYTLGAGLLIVYGVIAIVRQIAEPRIVGGSIGLHPLLTLAAMYIGFKCFGLPGMLLAPAAALALGLLYGDPAE